MTIRRSTRRISSERLEATARRLLDASTLCALATASPRGRAHVNAMYFAWDTEFRIVWISDPGAQHSRNLARNSSAAITVFDSAQTWGGRDRGIQLFGAARRLEVRGAREVEEVYADRFPDYDRAAFASYLFYRFRASRVKLFDEEALGSGTFVTARVTGAGRVEWEKTELYSG
jgi:uncharacterized protein YhbP (UPF0306 family)